MNRMKRLLASALISAAALSLTCAAAADAAQAAVRQKAASNSKSSRSVKSAAGQLRGEKKAGASDEELIDRIFDRWLEAQGGALLMMGVRSRVMRGSVEHSKGNVPGKFESYLKSPNKSLLKIDVPGAGQFIEAFDGRDAWLRAPVIGTFLTPEADAAHAIKQNAAAGFALKYRDLFSAVRYNGASRLDGREVHVVEGTYGGRQQVMSFDAADGLLVRVDYVQKGVNLLPLLSVSLEKYARVDGIQIPIRIKQVYKEYTVTFNVYEVKHNVAIQDALFENPKAVSFKPKAEAN